MKLSKAKTFGKFIPGLVHWEHVERKRMELRAAKANHDHATVSRLSHEMRTNYHLTT